MHEPDDDCAEVHCYAHMVDEPVPPGTAAYLVCGECYHVFLTARALRRAYRRMWRFMEPRWWASPARAWWLLTIRAGSILTCPHCIHDF